MKTDEIKDEWPRFDETDPPLDLTRENAAFERERARLVRDHLGQIALIHGDEVVGAYRTLFEAETEGYRRFGIHARLVCRPITEKDEPEFLPYVDPAHPSVRPLDGPGV
jgi:hypothetical protein